MLTSMRSWSGEPAPRRHSLRARQDPRIVSVGEASREVSRGRPYTYRQHDKDKDRTKSIEIFIASWLGRSLLQMALACHHFVDGLRRGVV